MKELVYPLVSIAFGILGIYLVLLATGNAHPQKYTCVSTDPEVSHFAFTCTPLN